MSVFVQISFCLREFETVASFLHVRPPCQAEGTRWPDVDFARHCVEPGRRGKMRSPCCRPVVLYISATKLSTIFCRRRRPRPVVGPFASMDYLPIYFSFKSTFNTFEFSSLTKNFFLILKKKTTQKTTVLRNYSICSVCRVCRR